MKKSLTLQHFVSSSLMGWSRRQACRIIKEGHIRVNGQLVTDPSQIVFPGKDQVSWKRKPLQLSFKKWYFVLNKPSKVLTSLSDPKGRPLISDYFPKVRERLFPVGRLDWGSEGLIVITNDGDWAQDILKKKPPKTILSN